MITHTHAIHARDLSRLVGQPDCPVIVDVRREATFEAADRVIASAQWSDHTVVASHAEMAANDVVVYCVHGHQVSQAAMARLRARGANARYLVGGFDAYQAVGGITVRNDMRRLGTQASRWFTSTSPNLDLLACSWFIRRFVDTGADVYFAESEWVTGGRRGDEGSDVSRS